MSVGMYANLQGFLREKNTGPVPDCKARGLATFSIDIFNTVSPLVKPLLVKIALIRV